MVNKLVPWVIAALFSLFAQRACAVSELTEGEVRVAMRMIGHQVLQSVGDSASTVLPIEVHEGRYKISFDTEFELNPDSLIAVIDRGMMETDLSSEYLVEVTRAGSDEVVHAFKMDAENKDLLPCRGRLQSPDRYDLFITLLDGAFTEAKPYDPVGDDQAASEFPLSSMMGTGLVVLALLWGAVRFRRNKKIISDPYVVPLGAYRFDQRNMRLQYKGETDQLTGKESDLLSLLLSSANATVEREVILNNVWGDEGDYVGRTLDVFISKLRKKLVADPDVRIVNVRGVGYKLVLNDRRA